jgi:hypothetical protein
MKPEPVAHCLICGKPLPPAIADTNEPLGGVRFTSRGNYGSTVYDPGEALDEFIEVVICDDDLTAHVDRVRHARVRTVSEFDYQPWNPDADLVTET